MIAGTLVVTERYRWNPLLAAGTGAMLLSTLVHQQPLFLAAGLATICAGEAATVAWLVQRGVSGPFDLRRVSDTGTLILFALTVPLAGGTLAATVVGAATDASPLVAWRSWVLADALGILATAPLLIAMIAERSRIRSLATSWKTRWKTLEFAIAYGATVLVTTGVFGEALDPVIRVPAYILPFLLWPAFRFGPGGTAATVLTVSLIGLWHAARGQGPLAPTDLPTLNVVLRSQGAMAVAAISLLLLASAVAERKRVAQENASLVTRLQQALAEVKTLRGFIPMCAWCHKVRDDAGFWQQIEMYLDARTDATFSHGICPACAEEAHDEVASHDLPPRVI